MSDKYKRALDYASKKHQGQYRVGGLPYITHPIAVAEYLKENGYNVDYQIAGLFHDLLEDTNATEEEVLSLSSKDVLEAVKILTKKENYIMTEYISAIKSNPIAKAVKTYDRLHNLKCAYECDESFRKRYILESIEWYLDFSNEIIEAIKELSNTLTNPYKLQLNNFQSIKKENKSFIVKGDICYSESFSKFITLKDGYLICIDGKSEGIYKIVPNEYKNLEIYDYSNKLIIPGLVDLHIHAPQFAFRGTGMDLELMDWLQNQTFPEETKYENEEYAEKAYHIFAEAMKKSATTHACIFATKHRKSTEILMDLMEQTGIISYVGKVNMDREAPESLCEPSADYSALDTLGWINGINGIYQNTKPILTPRFIPCCTPELLEQLRQIQSEFDLPVQSHLSENQGEIEFVRKLAPKSAFYGDAYDEYGLFGKNHHSSKRVKTIMAHCVYSTEEEMLRIKENGVFVAHCPASNMNLSSGIAPIRKYLNLGIKMGLGTDVAGGHSESMFRAICDTVQVSKLYWRLVDLNTKPLSFKEAFYLATKGGGEFFDKVGSFEKGYDCSFLVLDDSRLKYPEQLSIEQRIESAAYSNLDLFGIIAKYVSGQKVYEE